MGVFQNFADDRLDFLLRGTIIDGGHRVATKSLTSPLLVSLDFPPSREKNGQHHSLGNVYRDQGNALFGRPATCRSSTGDR